MKQMLNIRRAALLTVAAISASSVVSLQAADEPVKSPWATSASLGLTLTKGNSDTVLVVADIKTSRKGPVYELSLGADGTYGENSSVKNNEAIHGYTQYNRLFSERFYGYARVDALHDGIADINYRVTLSPGAGYYFIKGPKTTLSAEAGPGVVLESKGGHSETYATLRVAEKFEHKFSEKVRVWQSVEFLPSLQDAANYVINAEVGLESPLTQKASLRVYLQDSYVNKPADGRDTNDLKLVSALAWTF